MCQFSIIIEPLFESYNGMVSTASAADLCRSTLSWLDQHCSLLALRPSESSTTNADPNIIWTFEMTCDLFFPSIFLSGSEFTPPPEHHHSHPDRPQPAARAGHPCCDTGWAPCCPGPLLTAPHSRQYAPHVKVQSRIHMVTLCYIAATRLKSRTMYNT